MYILYYRMVVAQITIVSASITVSCIDCVCIGVLYEPSSLFDQLIVSTIHLFTYLFTSHHIVS